MQNDLLAAGQFAKLSSTTKRTVTWYDQEGILKPFHIDQSGYRYYKPEQIIDFQVILLLRHLHFSIDQIKEYLDKNSNLKHLFEQKKTTIMKQIEELQRKVAIIDQYYKNVDQEGVLVKPIIKHIASVDIYYLQKEGPYSKIYEYGIELKSYFKKLPKDTQFIAVFEEPEYKPVKSTFKIGVIITRGMELNKEAQHSIQKISLPSYRALVYTHEGLPSLLSFHWKQLEKYAALHHLKQNYSLPFVDIEIYKKNGFIEDVPEDQVITDIHLPIQ